MKLNFRPGKQRIRATFSAIDFGEAIRFGKIDDEKGILHDVQINLMGEAKGHGVWLGEDFIDGVVEQGNASKLGVKVRFGHPNMCADALGTTLGRAQNFSKKEVKRSDGTKCYGAFADVQLSEEAKHAPSGDLHKWTLSAAQNSPDTFGQSIVFTYADFYVVDKEGKKHSYKEYTGKDGLGYEAWEKQSVDGKRFAVIEKLLGTDFTDSPAATDGVFSADDLATQVTEMLDDNPQIMGILTEKPDTVNQFLERYNAALQAAGKTQIKLHVVTDGQDYDALTGRLAGLQSAKDKELAAKDSEIVGIQTALSDLKAKFATVTTDLEKATATLSAEQDEHAKTKDALADAGKQRDEAVAQHTALVGGVIGGAPDGKKTSNSTGFKKMVEAIEEKGSK